MSGSSSPEPVAPRHARRNPNIVITGTPGTGKTTHCEALAARIQEARESGSNSAEPFLAEMRHIAVNDVVRAQGCHDGYDEARQSWIVDEDRLLDALEGDMIGSEGGQKESQGGCIVDWHACDFLPESWVDLVVVLTADTEALYDRLAARQYADAKLQENLDAEIMQVLLQEAREGFAEEVVVPLASNTPEDMEGNVERIVAWIGQWKKDNGV